jgi:hypothetical protein
MLAATGTRPLTGSEDAEGEKLIYAGSVLSGTTPVILS